ncbi:unnamed protein product [Prorocentrum cordatum]|uniref:Apple domain-containing protein n=1 Tax=Prorocentrum cordatum TaxID=2364126 RepID=A0ABN9UKF5_9DINO|nr:unnamed protein product [Polarella glacialis]
MDQQPGSSAPSRPHRAGPAGAPEPGVPPEEAVDDPLGRLLAPHGLDPQEDTWRTRPRRAAVGVAAAALLACAAAADAAWRQHPRAGAGAYVGALEVQPRAKCLGALEVRGHGAVQVIAAGANIPGDPAGAAEVGGDAVRVSKSGRVYFAEACADGAYAPGEYSSINLLGRRLSFSVDLSGAQCGCVVAMYLTPLARSPQPGTCGSDYYCDAAEVCGVRCEELDIMEANTHAWHTTAHTASDTAGVGTGIGGSASGIAPDMYGPGSAAGIDTLRPFDVAADISEDGTEIIATLSQEAREVSVNLTYPGLEQALREGMAPILSYWHQPASGDLQWFDGAVCAADDPAACGETVVLYNFAVGDRPAPPAPPAPAEPGAEDAGESIAPLSTQPGAELVGAPATPPAVPPTAPRSPLSGPATPSGSPAAWPFGRSAPGARECWEAEAGYAPLDMPGQARSLELTASDCQRRCSEVVGCAHFSFWANGGCHLQDIAASFHNEAGAIAGPQDCDRARCHQTRARHDPLDMPGQARTVEQSPLECQRRCANVDGCAHFSYWPDGGCHLQDGRASLLHAVDALEATTGPPACTGLVAA